jgi:hypothetical protein
LGLDGGFVRAGVDKPDKAPSKRLAWHSSGGQKPASKRINDYFRFAGMFDQVKV